MTTHSASDDAAASTTDAAESSGAADAEAEAVDGEDIVAQAADGGDDDDSDANGDETVPHVELDLYQLSVRVSGQSTDSLEDVEGSAKELMSFLIQQAKQLEDEPDTRGLS
ncbi:hypothetical protein ACFQJC_08105 [Haloferax namakaokahaiae]|uniref:Uncharacterized protein n=1 Tax=Haloferax namakaokahaiae TaxID=1748331 RepID=A0ABD5ZER3_9EURY